MGRNMLVVLFCVWYALNGTQMTAEPQPEVQRLPGNESHETDKSTNQIMKHNKLNCKTQFRLDLPIADFDFYSLRSQPLIGHCFSGDGHGDSSSLTISESTHPTAARDASTTKPLLRSHGLNEIGPSNSSSCSSSSAALVRLLVVEEGVGAEVVGVGADGKVTISTPCPRMEARRMKETKIL
ncbi:hypothetical protein ACFX15_030722 [Malus domestica]